MSLQARRDSVVACAQPQAFSHSLAGCPKTKRWLDLAGACLGLVLLLPLGVIVALAIELEDRGPIFYGQIRVGQFGRPFRLWKFRSMRPGADRNGPPLTCGDDPRVTRVGRWLRRLKLDELPQLWNVLIGEMSLVGPRPEVPRYVQAYTPEQRSVLVLKPGLTDLASVLFRHEESLLAGQPDVEQFYLRYCLPRKIQLNLHYATHAGVLTDLWILARTIWVLVSLAGLCAARWGLSRLSKFKSASERPPQTAPPRLAIIGVEALSDDGHPQLASLVRSAKVLAIFDDNPRFWHKRVQGIPVAGMPECLLNPRWRASLDAILVILPKEDAARVEQLRTLFQQVPLPFHEINPNAPPALG